MKLEINIPKLGKAEGTCAWVAEQLSNLEFQFKRMKDGGVGLFFKDGQTWHWFASPKNGDFMEGADSYKEFDCVFPYHSNYDYAMLFGCPLTPAAFEYTQKFITNVVDRFEDQWLNDQ